MGRARTRAGASVGVVDQALAERLQAADPAVDLVDLVVQQPLELGNEGAAAPVLRRRDQLADLIKGEAQALGLADEAQLALVLGVVEPVAAVERSDGQTRPMRS